MANEAISKLMKNIENNIILKKLYQLVKFITSDRSLFLLSNDNIIRKTAKALIEWGPIDIFLLATILANCIALALEVHLPKDDKTPLNEKLESIEPYFLGIFCCEATLKIISNGFILHKHAYLRNWWNMMDFTVVITGLMTILMSGKSNFDLRTLRAMKVLRPVKLVAGIPSLQVIIKSIFKAMAPILQIGLLVLFAIIVFAIIGLEFFSGSFRSSCFNITSREFIVIPGETELRPCSNENSGAFHCSNLEFKNENREVICKKGWEGPNYGITCFDNILFGMLTVFQCITMEGWTDVMYYCNDALGNRFNWFYFVPLIIVGSFFMLNLVLGVLSGEFGKESARINKRTLYLKSRRKAKMEKEIDGYINWICKAEESILSAENTSDLYKRHILETRRNYLDQIENSKLQGTKKKKLENNDLEEELNFDLDKAFNRRRNQQSSTKRRKNNFIELQIFLRRLKLKIRRLVKSQIFYWSVVVLVFLNTFCIAVEHHNQPEWLSKFLAYAEVIFLCLFIFEMLLKIYGLGYEQYIQSSFNRFDCIVIGGSVFEIVASSINPNASYGISVLRALRLLRVFKVTRYWRSLRNLVICLISSIRSIISLLFLLFLFIVIFALLGMQLFGGEFNFQEGTPAANFDKFSSALLTVFQILTGSDWNVIMYNSIRAKGGPYDGGAIYSIYFIVLLLLGNYTILNIFLAIAVDNLARAQEMTAQQEEEEERERENRENEKTKEFNALLNNPQDRRRKKPEEAKIVQNDANNDNDLINRVDRIYSQKVDLDFIVGLDEDKTKEFKQEISKNFEKLSQEKQRTQQNDKKEENKEEESLDKEDHQNTSDGTKKILPYSCMFILGSENPLRKKVHFLVTYKYFDIFIMLVICASSIALASEDPVDENSPRNIILNYIDYLFTAVFAVEMILKIIDLGVIFHPGSYCRDIWNILDAVVVMCAIFAFAHSFSSDGSDSAGKNLSTIKSLRVLRVLRPLKTIKRVPKLKAVFECIVNSLKNVINILVVYMLFQFIFAVIAVQLFKGKFKYCTDLSKDKHQCYGYFYLYDESNPQKMPTIEKREWNDWEFHYDNIFHAMLTLFTVQTGEGWPVVLEHSIDASDVDKSPIPQNKMGIAFYYIVFFIVFPFFFVNVFVALIIITFQEQGDQDLSSDIDKNQKACMDFAINAKPQVIFIPNKENKFQYKVWKFVNSSEFEYFILGLIALNTVTLMLKWYDQSQDLIKLLKYSNIVFTTLFSIECILKMISLGLSNYIKDAWNIFDLVTVVGSIIDAIVSEFNNGDGGVSQDYDMDYTGVLSSQKKPGINLSFLRLFRAARLIKLLRRSASIRVLLWTFIQSFKALPYVCLLIAMLYFIFAIIGMQVFGNIKLDSSTAINRQNNFQNFPQALILLFRCSTGEGWQEVMLSCLPGVECEKPSETSESCGSNIAYAYFIVFIFLSTFLMLNLFVAVIMDNFDYLTRDSSILGAHHLSEFIAGWSKLDPPGKGKVHFSEICRLLLNMEPPVGFGNKCPKTLIFKRLVRMNMPIDEKGCVDFKTTLFALIRESLKIKVGPSDLMDKNNMELRELIRKVWPLAKPEQIDLLVPPKEKLYGNKERRILTIGKICATLLLLDKFRIRKKSSSNLPPDSIFTRIMTVITSQEELPKDISEMSTKKKHKKNKKKYIEPDSMISQQILSIGKIFIEPFMNETNQSEIINFQETPEESKDASKNEYQVLSREERIFQFKNSKYPTFDDEELLVEKSVSINLTHHNSNDTEADMKSLNDDNWI